MEVHLFRHGETNWNKERRCQGQTDSQLNENGIQQARELGSRIADIEFDKIYCSSSVRTRQTAQEAFSGRTDGIVYLDTLREIYLGPWEGRLHDEISRENPDSHRHFWHEPHLFEVAGAESFYDLQARAIKALTEIHDLHAGQRIAIVSHGAWIKAALNHWLSHAMEDLWKPPLQHNCAHSIVRLDDSAGPEVIQIADSSP